MSEQQSVYCEDCVEDIPNSECFWDDKRLYCGRCGSEIEINTESPDLFEKFTSESAARLLRLEDEDYSDEDEEDDKDEEDEIDLSVEDEDEDEEKNRARRN